MFLNWKNHNVNMTILSKQFKIQYNPYQIMNDIFHRSRTKKFHNLYVNKKSPLAKATLRKKMKLEESMFFNSKYKSAIIKIVWSWHKNRNIPMEQWNKIETHTHMATLSLTKESRNYNGEILFNKSCWENWTYKRMKLEHFLTPYTKINLKWIKI